MKKPPIKQQTARPVENHQQPVENPEPTSDSELTAAQAQIAELTNDLQRTRADFENFRKQVELQRAQAMSAARYATVEKFLPLLDDLDRAFAAYPDQFAPLSKNLAKTIASLGLVRVNSEVETEFNPDYHDAISVEDAGGDYEVIAETLRPGYLYEDVVIRPAMVKVRRIAEPSA